MLLFLVVSLGVIGSQPAFQPLPVSLHGQQGPLVPLDAFPGSQLGVGEVNSQELGKYAAFVGSDETGKGEWLGPLTIAAVALSEQQSLYLVTQGVMDSKKLRLETILELAKIHEVDLLVVGSHGRSAIYDILVGSISEGIIRRSSCPVTVVPVRG